MKNQIITLLKKLNQVVLNKVSVQPELTDELKQYYNQIKNVIIVRLDAIGDSLMFVNSVKQIRELFPNSTITFLCYSETEEIIKRSPYIDVPVFINRRKLEQEKSYREQIYTKLQNYSFDILINPLYSREFLAEEIVYFVNAELKIGFKGDVSNISPMLLNVTNKWYDLLLETESVVNKFELHRNAEMVDLLGGVSYPNNLPELFFAKEDNEFITNIISNYDLDNYAIVFPGTKGGKNSIKYWGSENYASIVDYIQNNLKLKVILLGGTDEEQICNEIVSLCKTQPIVLQGQFSLWKSIELLKQAKFYLGSDTSIAHFAAALKIETLVILGGGHFKRFFPYPGHNHVKCIYKELSCYNCNWKCTQDTNRCIKDITVNDVKQLLNTIKIDYVSTKESDKKLKNINLVFNTGSKPKIDLLLPPGNLHSWHLKEAWVINLKKFNLLNKVFYTDANNYQNFFDYLKRGSNSDLIFALGGDHHLYYLHDTQQKIDVWNKYKKTKACYSYESTVDAQYDFYKTRADNASKIFTHFLTADENDVNYYSKENKKAVWFPQFVDEKFFINSLLLKDRKDKLFFKGKLWSEYKLREQIVESLHRVKLLELVDGYLSNSELVANYNEYKAVINPPGVFGGFNVRTFEALACGNILFQFLPDNRPFNNGLFKHLEHIIYFNPKDLSALKDQIRDVFNNIDAYKEIAENGYNEVLAYHTLDKRLQTLLNWVDLDKAPEYPNYGLPKDKEIKYQRKTNEKINVQTNSQIKLSAVVSVYNSERFIEGCLKDLVEQTLFTKGELEIVVVNTGSEQNEEAIIKKYQQLYKNIKYIKTENRETIYFAWNMGINAASGKYITNANTDDRHKKDALEIMCNLLDNNKTDVIYADAYKTTIANDTWNNAKNKDTLNWTDFDKDLILFGCFIGPQPVWRKDLHEKFGLFNDQLKVVGDYEFWLRISREAKFLHLPEVLGLYYYSSNSAEHRNNTLTDNENKIVQEYYLAKYISTQNEVDTLKRKMNTIPINKVSPQYLEKVNELLAKRELGIQLEKEISAFLKCLSGSEDNNIIEKATKYLQKIDSSTVILNKEYYQESLNTVLGFYYLENNDLQNAKDNFENILSINNASSTACYGLGQIFAAQENFEAAKTMLEWAVKNDQNNQMAIDALKSVNEVLSLPENHNSLFENAEMQRVNEG